MQSQDSILFYDGSCTVCNRAVAFVHRHDRHHRIRLASYRSALARENATAMGWPAQEDSVAFLDEGKIYTHSYAVLKIFRRLGFPWALLFGFIIVPAPIRDSLYRLVAKYRHKWPLKKTNCGETGTQAPDECIY